MTISISRCEDIELNESPGGQLYPSAFRVDFGRPSLNFDIEMRTLLHWAAFVLDTGEGGAITNHRAAVLLRDIAEQHYWYEEDEVDWFVDERIVDPRPSPIDNAHLCLSDGFIELRDDTFYYSFSDHFPDQVILENSRNVIDFRFPDHIAEEYGIRGLRVSTLHLVEFLRSDIDRRAKALVSEDSWLDDLEAAQRLSESMWAAWGAPRDLAIAAAIPKLPPEGRPAPTAVQQDDMLTELAAML